MDYYDLSFFGLRRKLPLTYISTSKRIASFHILGDIEFTEKAGEEFEKILREKNIIPECFVGPSLNISPLVHHMAKRFGHVRYVILEKNVQSYMTSPQIKIPWSKAPKHAKNLVLNGADKDYLQGKRVVLVDDVISTGTTMEMLEELMTDIGAVVLAKCAIFKQGERIIDNISTFTLARLPIIEDSHLTS